MQSVYNFQLTNRKQRRWFIAAITLAALLLLLWVLGDGLYRIYETYKDRKTVQESKIQPNRPAVKQIYSIDTVIKTKLFGEQKKQEIVKKLPEKAPETKLDIALEGLLSANNETIARAIISVKKKAGKLYSVGDDIKDANAVLEEIREDGVLLNRNGIIENLAFVKKTISGNRSVSNLSTPSANNIDQSRNTRGNNGSNPTNTNRSRATNSSTNTEGNSKRRAIKRPNFKGLDKAIERELESALDDLNKQ